MIAALGDAIAGQQHDRAIFHGDSRVGGQADEGIAAEAFAALHGFEQVGKRIVGQFEVDRQRRVEIGKSFEGHRNAVVALGGEPVEIALIDLSHGVLRKTCYCRRTHGLAVRRGSDVRVPGPPGPGLRPEFQPRDESMGRLQIALEHFEKRSLKVGASDTARRVFNRCDYSIATQVLHILAFVVAVGDQEYAAAGGAPGLGVVQRVADHQHVGR